MLNGKIDPSLQAISKIAEILRVSAADLFSKNDG
jgi:DNA-binding XRE family transcriptional regulator